MLSEPVQLKHALRPANDSERFFFRQLLNTLIRVDCRGTVRPGLAESWNQDDKGRIWTLSLREDARLPGGMPVDPVQVASLLDGPKGKAAGIDSVANLDQRQVRLYLDQTHDTVPTVLADPALALLEELASADDPVRRFDIPAQDGRPFIRVEVAPTRDLRDAIDRGVGLVITRDPSVVEYVAHRPDYVTYPLPWNLTYVLLQPAGAPPLGPVLERDSLRQSLARDAVRAEARPAEGPFWWDSVGGCLSQSAENRDATSSRIVYPAGDQVARGLAERIVALSGDSRLSAASLSPDDFGAALRRQADRAYVLPVPRQTLSPCREAAGWPPGSAIQPLIGTRATAVVHRGSPALGIDWDGVVRVLDDSESSEQR